MRKERGKSEKKREGKVRKERGKSEKREREE